MNLNQCKEKDPAWLKYLELQKVRPELFEQNDYLRIETDINAVTNFEQETGRKIGVVYDSPYSMMVVDLVYTSPGKYFAYERLVPKVKTGAVVIVPVHKGKFVLLNQYRHAMREFQYAFPRGFGEKGYDSLKNAVKEAEEEIGTTPHDFKFIGKVVADSGLSGNKVDVYSCIADDISIREKYEGISSFILLDREEFDEWVRDGKINDGYTLAAYSLFQIN